MIRSSIMALALASMATFSCMAADAPAIGVEKAAKIGADYLAGQKAGGNYIVSVTLESTALVGGTRSWMVRWAAPLRADGNNEIGLRVKMDGSVARVVDSRNRGHNAYGSAQDIR